MAAEEEQSVSYWIFPSCEQTVELASFQQKLLSAVFPLVKDHIWQQEGFRLSAKDYPVPHLIGKTNIGFNFEDEWVIVRILLEVSKWFPNCVIHVSDTEGDFLLIEAAEFLPKWLTPEVAPNRVFVHQGKLHIIPAKAKREEHSWPDKVPSLLEGAEIVRRFPSATLADSDIQDCIIARLTKLSGDPHLFSHYAHCLLPQFLASLLEEKPEFVSPAVRCFSNRSPKDLKIIAEQKRFDTQSLATTRVRFTKCLFAQIQLDPFQPESNIWPLSPTDSPSYKASLLGAKLWLGFEIMCLNVQNSSAISNGVSEPDKSRWECYLNSLRSRGYFQDYVDGSNDFSRLLAKAKNFYDVQTTPQICSVFTNPGAYVLSLKESKVFDNEMGSNTTKPQNLFEDDDESWLPVKAEDLENVENGVIELFQSNKKKLPGTAKKILTQEVSNFFTGKGNIEGAEIPKKSQPSGKATVNFDIHEFETSVATLLSGKKVEVDDNDSSDMESYSDEDFDVDLSENGVKKVKNFTDSMQKYMSAMDRELTQTTISRSFVESKSPRSRMTKSPGADSIDLESDEFQPVNIDNNLVTNMLESFWSEQGASGPASAMLHGLKVKVPHGRIALDSDDEEQLEETLQKL